MKFPKAFTQIPQTTITQFIQQQPQASLVTWHQNHCEVGVFNPWFDNNDLYLHLHQQDPQVNMLKQNPKAKLIFHEHLCVIPSYWVDQHYGGMATMYYRHVDIDCKASFIDNNADKTAILKAMLHHYQPEGGHDPVEYENKVYQSPIDHLAIIKLSPTAYHPKWKLGQNLPRKKREHIAKQLQQRGHQGDLLAAQLINNLN